jgi:integrase
MLTVARTSEVRLAAASEFSGDLWTIPPARTKQAKGHQVPLTKEALAVWQLALKRSPNAYLFPSPLGNPLSDAAMAKLMKDRGHGARPHGFRATFRTWAEEQTNASFEVKEACLGHAVDAGVVGAYQRSDRLAKRRELLQTWSDFLVKA